MTLTVGSLFSGIGGFEYGFHQAGCDVRWQVEIDEPCRRVLAKHWPQTKRFSDVRDVGRRNLAPVDVCIGGFPCQDVSVAGRRAGLAGERSGLWWEFHRILAERAPTWVVIENVPGLLSSNAGRDMGTILRALGNLGYWWAYRVVDAQYFGVPQRRRRVFIVGHLRERAAPATVLFEPESLRGDSPPRRETRSQLAVDVAASLRSRGENTGTRIDAETGLAVVPAYQCHGNNVGEMGTLRQGNGGLTGGVPFLAMSFAENQRAEVLTSDVVRSITNGGKPGQGYPAVMTFSHDVAPALTSNYGKQPDNSDTSTGPNLVASPMAVRRLTPTETLRLQGLPDDWLDLDPPLSDSTKYRMVGNAVCGAVSSWLAKRIVAYTEGRLERAA